MMMYFVFAREIFIKFFRANNYFGQLLLWKSFVFIFAMVVLSFAVCLSEDILLFINATHFLELFVIYK